MTLLLTHSAYLDHLTPPGHPERPERLRAIAQVLSGERFANLSRSEAPEGNLDAVMLSVQEEFLAPLSPRERTTLVGLLQRLATPPAYPG